MYVYTRGPLGCLLGFWPQGQNRAEAIRNLEQFLLSDVPDYRSGSRTKNREWQRSVGNKLSSFRFALMQGKHN